MLFNSIILAFRATFKSSEVNENGGDNMGLGLLVYLLSYLCSLPLPLSSPHINAISYIDIDGTIRSST